MNSPVLSFVHLPGGSLQLVDLLVRLESDVLQLFS